MSDEHGLAHHGPPIFTKRDLHIAQAVTLWIATVREHGGFGYGKRWLPSGADFMKSRLFWRIRSGKKPLPSPPPTAYSCPWYELIDEPERAHWAWDMHVGDGVDMEKDQCSIAQCWYKILQRDKDNNPQIVQFGPYEFTVRKGPADHNKELHGWWIQYQPSGVLRPTPFEEG